MTEKDDRVLPLSRRGFLKAGIFFAIAPSAHLSASAETLGSASQNTMSAPLLGKMQPLSPPWMKDLIIYEVATKGFTSPHSPQSGTFNSLRSKLAYLNELGITGIWLAGYSLCDPHHFHNIWTQYAVIEPDKFDPTVGTPEEFKKLVDEAHQRGIKIFLDVITHGLMNDSPVIKKHPAWFRGGSWRMTDFDWDGGHTALDNWWIEIYTNFVTVYGVDGYRLDVDIFRPDLWERIRQNAAAAGHPIVIWEENNSVIPGVTDFTQRENLINTTGGGVVNEVLVNDLPGFYDRKFGRTGYYQVQIQYQDCSSLIGNTNGDGQIHVRLAGLSADRVGRRFGERVPKPDGLPDVRLVVKHVSPKPIENVIVRNDMGEVWQLRGGWPARRLVVDVAESTGPSIVEHRMDIYLATLAWGSSIELSCHDNATRGIPLDKSPYVAQGSRSVFGYSFLFSPMIPIFFSGEEFDATFHALPGLSPHLYDGKDAGKGGWLYGSMLDWNELDEPEHRDMFVDVKKMMAIRNQYSEVLAMWPGGKEPNLKAVQHEASIKVPVPYVRWNDRIAILIAANRNKNQNANLELKVVLTGLGLGSRKRYVVTDLWSSTGDKTYTEAELQKFRCTIKPDGTAGGGLSVFKIEST